MSAYHWGNDIIVGDEALDARIDRAFEQIREALPKAHAYTWDECHKIYVTFSKAETATMRGYGYDPVLMVKDSTPDEVIDTLKDWYLQSCGLRFISGIDYEGDWIDFIPQVFIDDSEEVTA